MFNRSLFARYGDKYSSADTKLTRANAFGKVGRYVNQTEVPLIPVPPGFQHFGIKDSQITFQFSERIIVNDRFPITDRYSRVIPTPQVNIVGTQFVDEQLPVRFTMAAIDYQSMEAGMLSSYSNSDSVSVGWVSDIVKWYYGEPNGQVSIEYQKQLSASSSYWLGQQENKAKLVFVRDSINDKYMIRIANLDYFDNGRSQKIGEKIARSFITIFNNLIEERIEKYLNEMRKMNGK